ncbi:uncharacterized protein Cbei_0202 isoform X2 [Phoenix dactylifera]|uniref:Uncharacterized protein Cbei_0202 isoform X2 n=1 Tax=Phoenix dactylifera TaxID=42345 RepID=A0A8B7CXK4_PHODC|nr:uncharacterized protein Cbei_0202 isoform X2 [Phoenix dactylifera]
MAVKCPLLPLYPSRPNACPSFNAPKPLLSPRRSLAIRCAKRTGKQRYPSEKKKLRMMNETLLQNDIKNRAEGFWRLSKLGVPAHKDPGKDFIGVSLPLLEAIAKVLEFPVAAMLPQEAFSIVRKSFDARKVLKEPQFVYTVDMDVKKLLNLEPRTWDFIYRLESKLGVIEYMPKEDIPADLIRILHDCKQMHNGLKLEERQDTHSKDSNKLPLLKRPKVSVIGSGPSGLFASLVLGELGAEVTLIERGQAVEQRGRDIGALVVRRVLQSESNFCFGEVMKTLVQFGAPPNILVDGKPHLGTNRLVPLLRNFRQHLKELGVDIKFGTRLNDLIVQNKQVLGVKVCDARHGPGYDDKKLSCDAVVLAVGHSARDVYPMLLEHNVDLVPKNFAVGLRIEHPQELINSIQYSALAAEVHEGRGRIPVADYKVVKYISGENDGVSSGSEEVIRSCYSFCMCPGGQVVLTSTNPSELCVNGMSFSRRSSRWANAALVVTVSSNDFDSFRSYGALAGVEFQREFERRAALMGGGNFVVPVQAVTDFLENKLSVTSLPPSSYRLGVQASNLHELFPSHITQAFKHAILKFDKELPGFISRDALLHGVETRTSSPVQILRHADTYESTSLKGLYPIGEGAGYAGGIVSAAVDGMYCGFAVAKSLGLYQGDIESILGKAQKNTGFVKY